MNIKLQMDFLRNYFKTNKIENVSTKESMSNVEVEIIRKTIKRIKTDKQIVINQNFTVEFKSGKVKIKDTVNEQK